MALAACANDNRQQPSDTALDHALMRVEHLDPEQLLSDFFTRRNQQERQGEKRRGVVRFLLRIQVVFLFRSITQTLRQEVFK